MLSSSQIPAGSLGVEMDISTWLVRSEETGSSVLVDDADIAFLAGVLFFGGGQAALCCTPCGNTVDNLHELSDSHLVQALQRKVAARTERFA